MAREGMTLVVAHSALERDCHLWLAVMDMDQGAHLLLPGDQMPWWAVQRGLTERVTLLSQRSLGSETSRWLPGLRDVLNHLQPSLIHVDAEAWSFTVQGLVRSGWPVIAHGAENVIVGAPWIYRVRRTGLGGVLNRLAGYAAWGSTSLQAAREAGLPDSTPICVVPARPPSNRDFPSAAMGVYDGCLRVASVGRLERLKGFDTLIDAARLISRTGPVELHLMGEGPERARLTRMATDARVPTRFHGSGNASQVSQLLIRSDAVVVASRRTRTWTEQWCRVAAEAILTGRPVFATATGELPCTVGVTDWLFEEGDANQLADLLQALRSSSTRRMAATTVARQYPRFDLQQNAASVLRLWADARNRATDRT